MLKKIFMYIFLAICSILAIFKIYSICVIDRDKYLSAYDGVVNRTFKGLSAPRGRILDVNGKVLVDNIGVNTIMFNKGKNISRKEEVDIAYKLSRILDIDSKNVSELSLKTFYLVTHDNGDDLITSDERELLRTRKLNSSDISALKYSRVSSEIIDSMSEEERRAGYIYYRLERGYSYQNKIIVKGVSDEVVAKVSSLNLKGVSIDLTWERTYPYESVLRSVFGGVSNNSVPKELKDWALDKGLNLEASVGTSGLELEYDDYLRGTDAVYKISQNDRIELVSDEVVGADVYLSIDIDTQLKVEEILKSEIINAKKSSTSTYFNHAYALVGHPLTGEIVAASGLLYSKDHFIDITTNIINSSYTVGSIVKGASMSVGYANNLIEKGHYVTDSCVKVYGVSSKCSWTSLGAIDDIKAMAQSSNYYQFLIAIKLTNPNYKWNSKLNATLEHFNIYRNMFASYGLGAITGVDLPGERVGIIGKTVSDDLLLNLAIGQYDTYTPIEIFQYVNTLANSGVRIAPTFMKKIVKGESVILERSSKVLNEASLNEEDMKRVQKGLRQVMINGTGTYYTDRKVPSAGKTGTSETFVDSNGDGKMDTRTISNAFIMYAPFDNPEYSIVVISPNITTGGYKYPINMRVNSKIYKYLFENRE